MKKNHHLIYLLTLFLSFSCTNNDKKIKLDLINGNLNNTPISSIMEEDEIKKEEFNEKNRYGDRYIQDIFSPKLYLKIAKAIDDKKITNGEYLINKYGISIGASSNDYKKKWFTTMYFEVPFDRKQTTYKGEISAGISKLTTLNEIRQLFGKEKVSYLASESNDNVYGVKYDNILNNGLVVNFVFMTSLKKAYINDNRYFFNKNGKKIQDNDAEKYITNLSCIRIKNKRWVHDL